MLSTSSYSQGTFLWYVSECPRLSESPCETAYPRQAMIAASMGRLTRNLLNLFVLLVHFLEIPPSPCFSEEVRREYDVAHEATN